MAKEKVIPMHKLDLPAQLVALMGDIIGEEGYITEQGTVKILGPATRNPDIPKTAVSSSINGPTLLLTAKSSLGFA